MAANSSQKITKEIKTKVNKNVLSSSSLMFNTSSLYYSIHLLLLRHSFQLNNSDQLTQRLENMSTHAKRYAYVVSYIRYTQSEAFLNELNPLVSTQL